MSNIITYNDNATVNFTNQLTLIAYFSKTSNIRIISLIVGTYLTSNISFFCIIIELLVNTN